MGTSPATYLTLKDVVRARAVRQDHVTVEARQGGTTFAIRIERRRVQVWRDTGESLELDAHAGVGRALVAHVRGLLLPSNGA